MESEVKLDHVRKYQTSAEQRFEKQVGVKKVCQKQCNTRQRNNFKNIIKPHSKAKPKKKSIEVKLFCSFNIETVRVYKWEKPVSRLLLVQQNSKRTLRWGK